MANQGRYEGPVPSASLTRVCSASVVRISQRSWKIINGHAMKSVTQGWKINTAVVAPANGMRQLRESPNSFALSLTRQYKMAAKTDKTVTWRHFQNVALVPMTLAVRNSATSPTGL